MSVKTKPQASDLGRELLQLDSNQQPFGQHRGSAPVRASAHDLHEVGTQSAPVRTGPNGFKTGKVSVDHAPVRRTSRAVAIGAELVLAAMTAVAYGTLGALVETVLDTARYVNAADHWRNGLVLFGVLLLVAWGRSAHRRWGAESTDIDDPAPAMSDREADALAYIITGLAEIEQHGLLRPEPRAVTQEVAR